ncbi:MAG TPA: hypothetical protein VGL06_01825 [Pseudonocardiaceae bacterium]
MTAAHMFVRQMLWRPAGARRTPEPVIALLGPLGAGKTHTLRAISHECDSTIVHALLDFANPRGIDPFAAVGFVAFEMMRTWRNLPKDPTFHRVGLSLLALNEVLPENRNAARAKIAQLIAEYVKDTREGRRAVRVADVANASVRFALGVTGIGATPQGQAVQAVYEQAKPAIADLLQGSARRLALGRSERWLAELLEDATLVDSLITLSRRRHEPLHHLMSALLADLADNAARRTIPVAKCRCLVPRDVHEHEHAWVLLVDNADNDSGQQFLAALVQARQQRVNVGPDREPDHDPLLVVTAVDQWTAAWGHWWQRPWQAEPDSPPRQRIPLLSTASFDQWTHAHGVANAVAWYPVWLDPPDSGETAQVPTGWADDAFGAVVRRLSGDLPAAAKEIGEQFMTHPSAADFASGVRSLLFDDVPENALWQRALRANLPDDLLVRALWRVVPDAVAVACRLVEPGATDDLDPATFPEAARTLRLLRTNLWISTFAARPSRLWSVGNGDAAHPAVLHPWLVRCLLAGLAAESAAAERRSGAWTWHSLFTGLSEVDSVGPGLYYQLASDRFDDVVAGLVERFVADDHRTWVRLLDYVTGAPCRWPALESTKKSVARLVPDDQPGRTPVQAPVANLVALLWLCRDPLTVPNQDDDWDTKIHASFIRLIGVSTRADTSALEEAAEQFTH